MSDNIPFDIQMEIIKRVSEVKSLIRFRSVSKHWKSFVESPEFIAFYGGVRQSQPHRLLLNYKESKHPCEVKYVSFVDDVSFPQQQLDFAPNVSDLVKQLKTSKGIGSSCGLWCLHGYDTSETEMVVIWNPSIRKSVGIVVPCQLTHTSEKWTNFGFGVCSKTYDPIIVGISKCFGKNKHKVGIFTLSTKTWKMIPSSNVFRESVRLGSSTQVAIDRFLFWVANDVASTFKYLIMSFDLITHEFKEVNLPDNITNQFPLYVSISKLNESLIVSAYTNEVNGKVVYGVWMMGKEGTSSTKLFNINTPDLSRRRLLGFRKNGEPIIETEKEGAKCVALEVYEPFSKHINNLGISGENGSLFICSYNETLLLADHLDGCIISNDH